MAKTINPLKTIKGLEVEYGLKPGALRFIFLEIGDGSVGHHELARRLSKRFTLPSPKAIRLTNFLYLGKFIVPDEERSDRLEGLRRAAEVLELHGRGKPAPERPDSTFYKLGFKTREYCKLKRLPAAKVEKTYIVAQDFHISYEVRASNKRQANKIEEAVADRIYSAMTDIATKAGGFDPLEGSRSVILENKRYWWSGHENLESIKHRMSIERFRKDRTQK